MMAMLSILGCYGAKTEDTAMLLVYNIFVSIMSIALVGTGVIGLSQVEALNYVSDVYLEGIAEIPDTYTGRLAERLNDAQIAYFERCCGSYYPDFKQGENILVCDVATHKPLTECLFDVDFFHSVRNGSTLEGCLVGEGISYKGDDLVGNPIGGGVTCSGTDPSNGAPAVWSFQVGATAVARNYLNGVSITLVVLGTFLLIAGIFSCYMACSKQVELKRENQISENVEMTKLTGMASAPSMGSIYSAPSAKPLSEV
jgi:hypothetical protein